VAKFIVCVVSILLWSACASTSLQPQTIINAAGCDPTSVQTAINNAAEGDTVYIPAGTCTWTTGVTVKGKGINILGAGSSRIIAVFNTSARLPLATGTITETITGADPGYPTPSITVGQTLQLLETGTETNTMTGTVTAWTPSTMSLTLNITGTTGACGSNSTSNCKRWMIATVPASVTNIVNDNPGASGPLFSITEDTAFHTSLSNFQVLGGTYDSNVVIMNAYAWPDTSGQAILIHDCRISENPNNPGPPSGNASMILPQTNKGVIWNCSFESSPFNISTLDAIYQKINNANTGSWSSPSNMGSLDTTGQGKLYMEDVDYHAMVEGFSVDDNGRAVTRYSLFDNSAAGTHGADTSNYGQRYFEFYNNTMVFEGYNDGTTFNVTEWFFMRGGTAVIANNIIPALNSGDYPNKADLSMTVMNLQRNNGPNPCWGSGFTTAGQYYHAPRQVGMGYVTGTGTATSPHNGLSNATNDSITYVGDSEPIYIWGNSRSPLNDQISDYGGTGCASPDSSANYIKSGRDYIDGTAKPGWSPYTWPHPLRANSIVSVTAPAPPVNVQSLAN
jgi:hypothetical protein